MTNPLWLPFTNGLLAEFHRGELDFSKSKPRFQAFAKAVPEAERIPMLLETYEYYRDLGEACAVPQSLEHLRSPDYFWQSCC